MGRTGVGVELHSTDAEVRLPPIIFVRVLEAWLIVEILLHPTRSRSTSPLIMNAFAEFKALMARVRATT